MKSANANQSTLGNQEILDLLEASHAIVSTFSVADSTDDEALSYPAFVKMLRGVDVLLTRVIDDAVWPVETEPTNEWETEDTLPESWMFKTTKASTVNVDMLNTACCRAQALVRMFALLGDGETGLDKLKGDDFFHGIWAVEGIIAQAIAIVRVGDRCSDDVGSDNAAKTQRAAA